jgi:DNA ligase (NAD+)
MAEHDIDRLIGWEDAYYNGVPLVSDREYDDLRDKVMEGLRANNPTHSYLDRVGAPAPDGSLWSKFTHTSVMGSLFKVNQKADFIKWASKRGDTFFLSEKADGCTITAYYEDGKLQTLATRGDGFIGEDITPNARYFENVKFNLPNNFTGVLRGEGLIYLDRFEEYFAPLDYSNPRNGASGKVRDTKSPDLKRHVSVLWFDLMSDDHDFTTWNDKFDFIKGLGLEVINCYSDLNPSQVWDIYEQYVAEKRRSLNYWIDGLVVRILDTDEHDSFGITDNRPKGSVAIKFPAQGVVTTLLAVEFNRGRSGRISIVGLIDPVLIDGTTVGRVSLHGQDWVQAMGLAIGDTVEVAKAGDIIPQIIKVIEESPDRKDIVFPPNCPDCGTDLVKTGAYIVCKNKTCEGEIIGAIAKWVEKLDIKGLGPAILQSLVEHITDTADMYEGDVDLFIRAANSEKTGKKLYKNVLASRDVTLAIFLSALHIDTLGSTNGQRVATHFKTLDGVLSASEEDFREVDGIDANASKIFAGLKRKETLIRRLEKLLDIAEVQTGIFSGKSFCITGKLSRKRGDVEAWIKQRGGICKGAVSKDLTYLVTNTPDSGSSKNKKADKYGVIKVTEDGLYSIGGGTEEKGLSVTAQFKQLAGIFGDDEVTYEEIDLVESGNDRYKIVDLKSSVSSLHGAVEQAEGLYAIHDVEIDLPNKKIRGSLEALKAALGDVYFVSS